jgi:pimeloyl-ACP methyl ester carboxylesterase
VTEVRHHAVRANGLRFHVAEAGAADGPLVLCCHGFPECWYSWRHQLPALAAAGWRVAAPDLRGVGRTQRPAHGRPTTVLDLTADAVGLVRALGADRAVLVGHDWGALFGWHAAVLRPDVFRAVVGMSVPFLPGFCFNGVDAPPTEVLRAAVGDRFHYMVFFQQPGAPEADLDADPERVLRGLLREAGTVPTGVPEPVRTFTDSLGEPPATLPAWLSHQELATFVGEFERTGFGGGIDWYRGLDDSWRQLAAWRDAVPTQPALFVAGALDPVVAGAAPALAAMAERLPDLRGSHLLDGVGHWVQQEAPGAVGELLVDFLAGLDS